MSKVIPAAQAPQNAPRPGQISLPANSNAAPKPVSVPANTPAVGVPIYDKK